MRQAAGPLAWARVLRASEGDLEASTEALRKMYAALKAHAARVAGTDGLPSAAVAQRQRALASTWMWHREVSSEQSAYTGRRRSLRADEGGDADRADQLALAAETDATHRRRHEEWDDTQVGEAEEAIGDEAGGDEPSDERWPGEQGAMVPSLAPGSQHERRRIESEPPPTHAQEAGHTALLRACLWAAPPRKTRTGSGSGSGGTRPSAPRRRNAAGACRAAPWCCSWPGRGGTNRRASGSSAA